MASDKHLPEVTSGLCRARDEGIYGATTPIVLPTSILVHDICGGAVQLWPYETPERPSAQYVRQLLFLRTRRRPVATVEEGLEVRSPYTAAFGLD